MLPRGCGKLHVLHFYGNYQWWVGITCTLTVWTLLNAHIPWYPCSSGNSLTALVTTPNTHAFPLHRSLEPCSNSFKMWIYRALSFYPYLPTKVAGVLSVLRDFYLLYHLSKRGSIAGTIFAHYSDLLRSFGLQDHT